MYPCALMNRTGCGVFSMSDLEGVMLSDYLLLKCISKGGVADVYQARQVTGEGNFEVAVKVFRPGYAQRESFREYFMTEAEKIGQFDHPNILPFLEFGEGEDLLYTVTPYVATGTLDDLMRSVGGKFSAIQALPIMQQLCSAVQYAHDHDVIHGNIKPSNIFIAGDGRMLLSDFGIARRYDDSQQSLTRVGWGSAEYAAPEQSLGVLRRASDIYTLGVLLFRILTGRPPFTGQTPVEVLLKHVRQQPPSARLFEPTISDAVDGVLHMAMQKRSDDRFASAEEFSNALQAAVTFAPIASPVAKAVSIPTQQLSHTQSQPLSDRQTPIPAHITLTPPAGMPPTPTGQVDVWSPPDEQARRHSGQLPTPKTRPLGVEGDVLADVTDKLRRGAVGEDEGVGTHMFWPAGPVEWSPLGSESESARPLTAGEYLGSKPLVPATPQSAPVPAKQPGGKDQNASTSRLKKILPIIVVILLLLGLLGALLSSLFYSNGSSGAPGGSRQSAPASGSIAGTTGSLGATVTATVSPAGTGTATPGTQGTTAPTVVANQPAPPPMPTPTPVPTSPPVPAFACSSGTLTLDGSDSFQPAIQQLTADYSNQCSGTGTANFTVNADGSKGGLDAVASGSANLAYSDLTSVGRAQLVNYQVAGLIYAVIVNSDTQVTGLSTAQLQGIYSGSITNWSQVGGSNEPIVIITRPADSAIRAIFESYVLKGVAQSVSGISLNQADSSTSVADNVVGLSGAISYLPLAAVPTSGAQSIAIDGVSASADAIENGTYAFWSVEHLYSNQLATGLALSFISFFTTSTGTADLANFGAVPIENIAKTVLNGHMPGPTV